MKGKWLFNKTVIITGASGGLGFAVSKLLIEKYNCNVIGIARNEAKILSAIQILGTKKDKFSYKLFDVSVKENWLNFYDYLLANNIRPDILINNAGFMLPFAKFENYSEKEIEDIVNTNFMATINSTQTLLPLLKQSDTPAIVNVASAAGACAVVGQSMYCATKFAVRGFTEALQQDYKKQIYVSGIYPGFIRTDIMNRQKADVKDSKIINKFMMPLDKAAKKVVKSISKKKKRVVIGFDGHAMSFFSRLFPKATPKIITVVLKASKLELFNDVFN